MDEFEIIRRFFVPNTQSKSVIVGVGDDGAVLRPEPGHDLVTVVDTMVAGVHFPDFLRAEDIGYRAIAVNLSDIAAMGGRPRWMTLALTLEKASHPWLQGFARGIFSAAETYGVELVGGDTTSGHELVVSVQIIGDLVNGQTMTRSGAQSGDGIYVSGTVGDANCGLSILQDRNGYPDNDDYLVRRFTQPDARIDLGQEIAAVATAAIDLSDGLFADLDRLLLASGVGGEIEIGSIPLSRALSDAVDLNQAREFALAGGDDYELCFTAPNSAFKGVTEIAGVPIARIGQVTDSGQLSCTLDGEDYRYHDVGYRHFNEQ